MRTRIRNEKGAALLETAITIPIILLISVGIFEFGRAYQTWQVLTNAAREGARVAIITGNNDTHVQDVVKAYLSNGQLTESGSATIIVNRNVAVAGWASGGSQVEISYPFKWMLADFNSVFKLVSKGNDKAGKPFTMKSVALMRNEG